jgi:hypothetical protein
VEYFWKFYKINNRYYIGFEVFTAVVLKSIFFWDMRPHIPILFSYWSYDLLHQFHPVLTGQ